MRETERERDRPFAVHYYCIYLSFFCWTATLIFICIYHVICQFFRYVKCGSLHIHVYASKTCTGTTHTLDPNTNLLREGEKGNMKTIPKDGKAKREHIKTTTDTQHHMYEWSSWFMSINALKHYAIWNSPISCEIHDATTDAVAVFPLLLLLLLRWFLGHSIYFSFFHIFLRRLQFFFCLCLHSEFHFASYYIHAYHHSLWMCPIQ